MEYYYSPEEIARQREIDIKKRELMWGEIADEIGGERGKAISEAIKDLYSIYDERLVDWTANLYDKGWGSFYASPIGKETEGFVPDVESTHQVFSFISGSGMLDNYDKSCKKGLPEWMIPQVVYYAKSLQDTNGYFYHPHWSKTTADEQISHKSRDLYRCIYILEDYGESHAVYDTPTGEMGDGIGPDEYWASLGTDAPPPAYAFEYNKKKSAAKSCDSEEKKPKSSGSDYLKSHTAFIDYITDSVVPRMIANPYHTGNEVGETARQIKAYSEKLGPYKYEKCHGEKYERFDGMTLTDISITCLNEIINEETGLWGALTEANPLGTEFCYVNGFMKAMAAYNLWGYAYPTKHLEKVANALTETLLGDEESPYNICAIYNVWASICRFKQNIALNKDIEARDKALAIVDGILKEKAPEALRNTKRKLIKYKKDDGGFGHSYTSGTPTHQCMPVSTGENASDVDATVIGADHLLEYIFYAFDMKKPPILMPSDWMRCRNLLDAAEPVVKTRRQERRIELSKDSKNPFRAKGAKLTFNEERGGLRVDFDDGSIALGLTAKLYGYDSNIFEMNAGFAPDTSDAEIEVKLQSFKNVTICSFGIIKAQDGIYCRIGNERLRIADVCDSFTVKTRYKNSTLSLEAGGRTLSCPAEVEDYPADGIYTAELEAKNPCALDIYSIAFHLNN